jgi:6-phosphogluconolactonase
MKTTLPSILTTSLALSPTMSEDLTLWIGTGGNGAKGIYRTTLNTETGKLTEPVVAAEIGNPGFLTLNAEKTRLYSLCNIDGGSVAAFSIGADKSLTLINTRPIGDGGAAHLSLDKTGKVLFTAQYGAGSVAAFPVSEDGSIGERTSLIKHSGSGPDKTRQEGPHPHSAFLSPDNRFLLVPDLGTDKIVIYEIDHAGATLKEHSFGTAVPGGGPRHLKFGSDGTKVYVLNEMGMTLSVFDYDAKAGAMTEIQTIETLPKELWEIPNKAAEVRVHPGGKFVYASNRGHDTIAAFSVDEGSGKLTFVEREPIRGAYPRNFNVDPTGQWLIAAGRASNTLAIFKIDLQTGGLIFTTDVLNVPSPICLEF